MQHGAQVKEVSFWPQNLKRGLCVVRTQKGLPCSAKAKYACCTCDRHEKHEEAATAAVKAHRSAKT